MQRFLSYGSCYSPCFSYSLVQTNHSIPNIHLKNSKSLTISSQSECVFGDILLFISVFLVSIYTIIIQFLYNGPMVLESISI